MKSKQKVCNKELLSDTQLATKEAPVLIKGVVDFYSKFIAETMKIGAFETIMVPYFGKFQPKTKEIQWKAHRKGMTTPKPKEDKAHDEPIHDN
jgi:hypothetical protein